jgi:putative sporulation protein YyaC
LWSLFGKHPGEESEWRGPFRVHVDHPTASLLFRRQVGILLRRLYQPGQPLAILCIGTDRSTGDCLGPLIGTKLAASLPGNIKVLGTLDRPVHAVNLTETMDNLRSWARDPFIVAIDACLGRTESVGFISLKEGPLQPGTGVNKTLPAVGDLHIVGIVNVGGFMEYLVLQNTRLSLVMHMSEIIADAVAEEVDGLAANFPGVFDGFLSAEAAVSQPEL